jgi:hypothetical protein
MSSGGSGFGLGRKCSRRSDRRGQAPKGAGELPNER